MITQGDNNIRITAGGIANGEINNSFDMNPKNPQRFIFHRFATEKGLDFIKPKSEMWKKKKPSQTPLLN